MTPKRDHEAPLSAEDVTRILSICSPRGLLVGGQALAFWADHLQVERPADLVSGVTASADFIGDALLAKNLEKLLGWDTWIPALYDSTAQTGKVSHRLGDGSAFYALTKKITQADKESRRRATGCYPVKLLTLR